MVGDDDWWTSHWEGAPTEIREFLGADDIALAGAVVADLGCGDGIMAAGLANLGASVVGFDLDPTDPAVLEREAKARGVDVSGLDVCFRQATADRIDADDGEFDLAVSWSVMEHVFDREGYMREARRVIKPGGHLLVQVWPLWHSEHGHHLWQWLHPFDHLRQGRDGICQALQSLVILPRNPQSNAAEPKSLNGYLSDIGMDKDTWMSITMASYDSCNRITIDEVQTLLLEHGFGIGRVDVMTATFHVPRDLQSIPISRLAPCGFKMTAWRKP
jgi:SAM-dependent methyltransferase